MGIPPKKKPGAEDILENDKKLDVGHDRFSAGEYSAFSKVAGTVENAFAKSSVAVDTGAPPDKKDKGRLS